MVRNISASLCLLTDSYTKEQDFAPEPVGTEDIKCYK